MTSVARLIEAARAGALVYRQQREGIYVHKRKLIEVALPLEAINRESTRENYIYKRNPSSIHKWWAQRPLAAARAVLFAQLVDDPVAHPDRFPTEVEQRVERDRLHQIIKDLVVWENSTDEALLARANTEIINSCNSSPPRIVDPFAGGGTIPIEAQRLGLRAVASDLNPVAVLINKALGEYPAQYNGLPPIRRSGSGQTTECWIGPEGLMEDIRNYGSWVLNEARLKLAPAYPGHLIGNREVPVLAWLWTRTVPCPNPACEIEAPLVASWWLSKRKNRFAWIEPTIQSGPGSRKNVSFTVVTGSDGPTKRPTVAPRQGATCLACSAILSKDYIKTLGMAGRIGYRLLATVVEIDGRRSYVEADSLQVEAAAVHRPSNVIAQELAADPRNLWVQQYGYTTWDSIYTARQLMTLLQIGDLIHAAREMATRDARRSKEQGDIPSHVDPGAYGDCIAVYLTLALTKCADYCNSLVAWYPQEDRPSHLFTAHTVPMAWDFVECNPLGTMGGTFSSSVRIVAEAIGGVGRGVPVEVLQRDARTLVAEPADVISTDPPYYDNISYADIGDFFYVWHRLILGEILPENYSTMVTPKDAELIASPYRAGNKELARKGFEEGFFKTFANLRASCTAPFPMTLYYAYKQSTVDGGGEGWETILQGLVSAGWTIVATWPIRSERGERRIGIGTNALASSIVLVARPREFDARTTDRAGFLAALREELPGALKRLQQSQVAPVDLPQSAIGPGMAVFSRFAKVVESDGSAMTVRAALARINDILDQVLTEQEGDFDAPSRFAIAWYRQNGYATGPFGSADDLARARNTSVELMDRHGILSSRAGKVTLLTPSELPMDYDPLTDPHTSNWEALHHLIRVLESDGIPAAGSFLAAATSRRDGLIDADLVKELAFLLFSVAEKKGWTKDALSFNAVAQSWPDIVSASRDAGGGAIPQGSFEFDDEGE